MTAKPSDWPPSTNGIQKGPWLHSTTDDARIADATRITDVPLLPLLSLLWREPGYVLAILVQLVPLLVRMEARERDDANMSEVQDTIRVQHFNDPCDFAHMST